MTRTATCGCGATFECAAKGRPPARCPTCRWGATRKGRAAPAPPAERDVADGRAELLGILHRTESFCRGMRRALGDLT